jgi:hypothetical protein
VVRGGEGSRPLSVACRPWKGHSGTAESDDTCRLIVFVVSKTNCLPGPMFIPVALSQHLQNPRRRTLAKGFAAWNSPAPLEQVAAPSMASQLAEKLQQLLLHLIQTSEVPRDAKQNFARSGPEFRTPEQIKPRLKYFSLAESSCLRCTLRCHSRSMKLTACLAKFANVAVSCALRKPRSLPCQSWNGFLHAFRSQRGQ